MTKNIASGLLIRINQLPVLTARLPHGYMVCFETFSKREIAKVLIAQQPLKLENKNCRFVILRMLQIFLICLSKLKKLLVSISYHVVILFYFDRIQFPSLETRISLCNYAPLWCQNYLELFSL
jgi:hypothetical protein